MSILANASELLGSPSGSFVYHLMLLLVVQAILGMAVDQWQRTRYDQPRRLFFVAVGLTLARFSYVIPSLISQAGWAPMQVWLPPLERFADTASIVLLGWAFAYSGTRGDRIWDLVFAGSLALTVASLIGFTILWKAVPGVEPALGTAEQIGGSAFDYNLHWQSTVWSLWQALLIVLAGLAVILNQNETRATPLAGLFCLFLGRLIDITYPASTPNLPIWDRLANLVSFPLFGIAFYRQIVLALQANIDHYRESSQAWQDQFNSLRTLFQTTNQASGPLDLPSMLDSCVQGIARALALDQCAIALPEETDPTEMRLEAVYGPSRQGREGAIRFPLEYQRVIQQAMRRKKSVRVEEGNELDNVQLKVLFALLGSDDTGPLLVQPILLDTEVLGAIILGNSRSRRPFTSHEDKLSKLVAEKIAVAIQSARYYRAAQERIKELHRTLDEERHLRQQAVLPQQEGRSEGGDRAAPTAPIREPPRTAVEERRADPSEQ